MLGLPNTSCRRLGPLTGILGLSITIGYGGLAWANDDVQGPAERGELAAAPQAAAFQVPNSAEPIPPYPDKGPEWLAQTVVPTQPPAWPIAVPMDWPTPAGAIPQTAPAPGSMPASGAWMMVWVPYGAVPPASGSAAMAAYPVYVPWGQVPGSYGAAVPYPQSYPQSYAQPYPQPYPAGAISPGPALPLAPGASLGQVPSYAAGAPALPSPQSVPLVPGPTATLPPLPPLPPSLGGTAPAPAALSQSAPLSPPEAGPLTEPSLDLQGLYVLQGDDSSARARLRGTAFLTPNLLVGGTLDFVTGPDVTNADGLQVSELYLAAAIPGAPGLRFSLGQLDLTSYFDRNSFAKDVARDFFNSTFHTNPALIAGANATASRLGGVVQWAATDDIGLSASVFSSSPNLGDFALDGFAGEASFRTGNLIVRGTYVSSTDTEFQGTGERLQSYGVNAEYFFPQANLGLFGRYGWLENQGTGLATDTYSLGVSLLDVFMADDRLGLAYGRNLETSAGDGITPDVLELFYDFEILPHLRAGFTLQQRNAFQETFAGFRLRGDLNLAPSLGF